MYGIQAINANNGWAMALAGALIVMSGLSVLSFIISQLHKIIGFFENMQADKPAENPIVNETEGPRGADPKHDLSDLAQSLPHYQTLTANLGNGFTLPDLFDIFRKLDFPHPHLTIRSLKEEGFLVQAGEDTFTWKN